ncbi:MAG: chemotaxis protein CheA [Planctomycetes bacterium]|nr:chemotaxis protein CheA [Planctomycetota bacterium]
MMNDTLARIVAILATKAVLQPTAQPSDSSPEPATALFEIRLDVGADRERPRFDVDSLLAQLAARGRVGDCDIANTSKPGAATHRVQFTTAMSKSELEALLNQCGIVGAQVAPVSGLFDDPVDSEPTAPDASIAPNPPIVSTPPESPAPTPVATTAAARGDAPSTRANRANAEGDAKKGPEAASIRVPIEKVDKLINLIGELVITQSMVAQLVNNFSFERLGQLEEAVSLMDRHARDLRERIMAVRMIPIKTLFSKFHRLVRDLVTVTGKRAELEIEGEETELDKTVIEKIGDPLTHLIRNSMDHGLETPDERQAAGKPEHGTIRLVAYQQGGKICIEVSDDGRGIDRDRVVQKAIEKGLVPAGQALTDEQAFALIFKPGFSTAAQVTEISGRGVGMDVVKRNVEELGGTIAIRSERGKGTQMRIALPLTLAILDGQALCVGKDVYILPLVSITESIRPNQADVHAPAGGPEVVLVRGRALPILRLNDLLGLPGGGSDLMSGLFVIVENEGRQAALFVDELLGQQQVVIKGIERNYQRVEGIAGATILGDGRVALILDVPGIFALSCTRIALPA